MKFKTLAFTGHRPQSLPVTCWSPTDTGSKFISNQLIPELEKQILINKVNIFISGGALGFDQIAFWTVEKLKITYPHIKNHVAIPCISQTNKWKDEEVIRWYYKMLEKADKVIYVDEIDTYKIKGVKIGEYHVAKLQKRNEYMVDQANLLFALWNGKNGGTGNCVRYGLHQGKEIWQMNPLDEWKTVKYAKENKR